MAFHVYDKALQMLARLKVLLDQVRRHDRPLADQMQRAGQSTFLNIAEGRSARGRNELARFQMALTECRETRAALQLAVVTWGYVSEAASAGADDDLDQIAAMLWVLVHRPRQTA
jgi:four helix bundle protein